MSNKSRKNSGQKTQNRRSTNRNRSTSGARQQASQQSTSSQEQLNVGTMDTSQRGRAAARRNARRQEASSRDKKKKQQLQMLLGLLAVAVAVVALMIFINRPSDGGGEIDYDGLNVANAPVIEGSGTPAATPGADQAAAPYRGVMLGDPNAPVTFVIYSDFQCHFCQQFHVETLPKIIDDFVRDGQVKIEFREYPSLGGQDLFAANNGSANAAEAAMCAGEQDEYLEYSDKLFANFSADGSGYDVSRLKDFADDLDLDTDAFNACLDSGRYVPAIQQSKNEGTAAGITATPMFILDNGQSQNTIQQTSEGYDLLKRQIEVSIEQADSGN